jgi:hypothetical protein
MDDVSGSVMSPADKIREIIKAAQVDGFPAILKGARVDRSSNFDLVARLAYLEGLQRALEIIEESDGELHAER